MSYLSEISKIIDKHRADAVITCEETCWCWDVEAAICGHESKSSKKRKENKTIRKIKDFFMKIFTKIKDEICIFGLRILFIIFPK